jgi:uncharacterized membrane protein YhhN
MAVAKFIGQDAFLLTHAWFEIGIIITFFASIVYSIRLFRNNGSVSSRWPLILNLIYGPLILVIIIITVISNTLTNR